MKYYRFYESRQIQVTIRDDQTEEDARKIFEQRKDKTKFNITATQVSVKSRAYKKKKKDKDFISLYEKRGKEYILLSDLYGRYKRYMMDQEVSNYAGKGQFLKMLPFESEIIRYGSKTYRKVVYCG